MTGAIAKAEEMLQSNAQRLHPQQFKNPANPESIASTTAEEIWSDTDGKVDILVGGVGTGGTITGVGEVLKARKPGVKIIAVEPVDSPVLSGGQPGPAQDPGHRRGIRARRARPEIYRRCDRGRPTTRLSRRPPAGPRGGDARRHLVRRGRLRGLRVGQRPENAGKLIVAVLPDLGERYLSTPLFPEPEVQTADAAKISRVATLTGCTGRARRALPAALWGRMPAQERTYASAKRPRTVAM